MDREEIRKILKDLKSRAPEGVPLHQKYGWGGFVDKLESEADKKTESQSKSK
jgi:hypothetical protein